MEQVRLIQNIRVLLQQLETGELLNHPSIMEIWVQLKHIELYLIYVVRKDTFDAKVRQMLG